MVDFPEIQAKPNQPIRSGDMEWEDYSKDSVRFGDKTLPLGDHGGATQVGFNLVELPPGKQSCPFHYHMKEEEHYYILEGRCVLRSGEEKHEMKAGDYVCFPAGTGVAHATLNPFSEPCKMIVVGSPRADSGEVCVYPDSKKVLIKALKAIIPWPQESLDYNHGEPCSEPLERQD